MTEPIHLDRDERAAIVAEYDRLARQPVPPNKSSAGCSLMLLAVVFLIIAPRLVRALPHAPVLVLVIALVILLAGVVFFIFPGGGYARAAHSAQEALAFLATGYPGTPEERRNAAVAAVWYAFFSDGPSTTTTYDFDAARTQIGNALPYVQAVERVLVEERKAYTVFTAEKKGAE